MVFMGERRGARWVLVWITEENRLLGRPRRRGSLILIGILIIGEDVERNNVAQDENKWCAIVNNVMNFGSYEMHGIS
jgi:hypothetical protein